MCPVDLIRELVLPANTRELQPVDVDRGVRGGGFTIDSCSDYESIGIIEERGEVPLRADTSRGIDGIDDEVVFTKGPFGNGESVCDAWVYARGIVESGYRTSGPVAGESWIERRRHGKTGIRILTHRYRHSNRCSSVCQPRRQCGWLALSEPAKILLGF